MQKLPSGGSSRVPTKAERGLLCCRDPASGTEGGPAQLPDVRAAQPHGPMSLQDSLEAFAPETRPRVPHLVKLCVSEIERRGLQEVRMGGVLTDQGVVVIKDPPVCCLIVNE